MFLIDEIHSLLFQSSFNNKCQNTSKENFDITLKKHVYVDHYMIAKIFEEKVNNVFKDVERQPKKKRPHVNGTTISNFFVAKNSYKKYDVQQYQNLEDLALLIVKNHLPMHLNESQWLVQFILHLCPKVVLLFKNRLQKKFC
jgi:hypothetical protein